MTYPKPGHVVGETVTLHDGRTIVIKKVYLSKFEHGAPIYESTEGILYGDKNFYTKDDGLHDELFEYKVGDVIEFADALVRKRYVPLGEDKVPLYEVEFVSGRNRGMVRAIFETWAPWF